MPITDRLRAYAGSPTGSKVVPGVSIGLVVVGALLIILGFFGGGGSPEEVVAEPEGPPATEQLTDAMAVAKEALVNAEGKKNSYKDFDATIAAEAAPDITWTDGAAPAEGEVSIRITGRTGIVLVTLEGETVYCIADDNADEPVSQGSGTGIDPQSPEECTGGW